MRVLAVDGGQSGIRLRHAMDAPSVEVGGVSRLEGDTVVAVASAVVEGWRRAGSPAIDRVAMGLTTAPTDEGERRRLCDAVAAATGAPQVWLADDAVTGHAGALSLGWGVSITAGTGVACLAMPADGPARIIGGHGFLVGDEGGGYWIGREGLRAALRSVDGRAAATALSDAAARRFGGLHDLGDRLHSLDRPVDAIGRFAPDVMATAEAGDPTAAAIVDEAARELVTLARAGVDAADSGAGPVPLALGGGLLGPGSTLRLRVERRLSAEVRSVSVRDPDGTPLDGAWLLVQAADPGRYDALVYRWSRA